MCDEEPAEDPCDRLRIPWVHFLGTPLLGANGLLYVLTQVGSSSQIAAESVPGSGTDWNLEAKLESVPLKADTPTRGGRDGVRPPSGMGTPGLARDATDA